MLISSHRRRPARALTSVALLVVQVLALAHLAVAEHVVTPTGALVDVVGLSVEQHTQASEHHLCATEDDAAHPQGQGDCLVGASWKTSRVPLPMPLPVLAAHVVAVVARGPSTVPSALPPLALAPKGSPPAR